MTLLDIHAVLADIAVRANADVEPAPVWRGDQGLGPVMVATRRQPRHQPRLRGDGRHPRLKGHGNEGIGVGDAIYVISYDRCTECVGHFDEPQCSAVCPVADCCIADPAWPESKEILLDKAIKLNPGKQIDPAKVWSNVRQGPLAG